MNETTTYTNVTDYEVVNYNLHTIVATFVTRDEAQRYTVYLNDTFGTGYTFRKVGE